MKGEKKNQSYGEVLNTSFRNETLIVVNTLRNSIQSFPLQRDFRTLTAVFQDVTTERATRRDISSEKWKVEG